MLLFKSENAWVFAHMVRVCLHFVSSFLKLTSYSRIYKTTNIMREEDDKRKVQETTWLFSMKFKTVFNTRFFQAILFSNFNRAYSFKEPFMLNNAFELKSRKTINQHQNRIENCANYWIILAYIMCWNSGQESFYTLLLLSKYPDIKIIWSYFYLCSYFWKAPMFS